MKLKTLAIVVGSLAVLATAGTVHASNLIQNGNFATGDFTDWTLTNASPYYIISPGYNGDTYCAAFGAVGHDGTLSQDVTTVVGDLYAISFVDYEGSGTPSDMSSSFGGVEGFDFNPVPQDYTWDLYSYDVVATSTTSEFDLNIRQDPGYQHIDDISVIDEGAATPTPEASTVVGSMLGIAGLAAFAFMARRKTTSVA